MKNNALVKLYIDDLRTTPIGYQRVYSYKEFIDFISFDHDLGLEETGYDCVKFLVNYCLDNQ